MIFLFVWVLFTTVFANCCLVIFFSMFFTGFLFFCFCFSAVPFVLILVLVSFLINAIISFIASIFAFMSVSICLVCASVRLLISSLVASAVSSIKFALNCLAVALVCLFSFAYSLEMNVLMFVHVFVAAVLFFHSRTAGSYSPVFFQVE